MNKGCDNMKKIYMLRNNNSLALNYGIAFKNEEIARNYILNNLGGKRLYNDEEIEDLELWKYYVYIINDIEYQLISIDIITRDYK